MAFVLVGGVAAQLNGSPLTTEDVDLTPDQDAANLQRCAQALNALGAQWRVPGLTQGQLHGAGRRGRGRDRLRNPIAIASVDAIISAKEAAGRDKDARALPFLYDLQGRGSGAEP